MANEKDNTIVRETGSTAFEVVAMASSAGGLAALSSVLSELPKEFPVAIVIVQHLDRNHPSMMASILNRRTDLDVVEAKEGDLLQHSRVYMAPPNRHLLVNADETLSLSQTELVHFVRPSADLLFESVATSYKTKAIAVVLTGSGMDGGMGVRAIKKTGGKVIVQNQDTAAFFGMPGTAIATGCADYIIPLNEIAAKLISLVAGAA